jgi:dTDP-glucose pyrophosphorylase
MTDRFNACRLQLGAPLRKALQSLDESALGIVLVEDQNRRVVGTLTDGDLRRALLRGATLEALVDDFLKRQFAAVGPNASRAEVLDVMQSRWLNQIPILDDDGRLIGLHLVHEILGGALRPNWAVVMAGGRGERLKPLTDTTPKPMLRIAGRPILERIILHLVGSGLRRIFLAVNYKADVIEEHFGDGSRFGCVIEYLRENKPLGTGGALSLLPMAPADPILVLNGDLLTQFDVGSLLNFHARGHHRATVGVHEYSHTVPFGVVEVDHDRIVQLREKPAHVWLTNAGIYVLDPDVVGRVPPDCDFPLPSLIEDCVDRNEGVGAFRIETDWIDVGRQAELAKARGLT